MILGSLFVLQSVWDKQVNNNKSNKSNRPEKEMTRNHRSFRRFSRHRDDPLPDHLIDLIHAFLNNPKGKLVDIHYAISEEYLYYSQWSTLQWKEEEELQGLIDLLRRYELNGLQLHGKPIYLIYHLLKYTVRTEYDGDGRAGGDGAGDKNENVMTEGLTRRGRKVSVGLLDDLIELLLRILLEYPAYLKCFQLLDLLVTQYDVSPRKIFDIGK